MSNRTAPPAAMDAWRDQRRWSNTANALKSGIEFWRTTALTLAVAGAVLATSAIQFSAETGLGQALSLGAAVALAVVPVIRTSKLSTGAIEAWTRARSVSEGLKEEVYLYLTRTPPYGAADRDAMLREKTSSIVKDAEDIDALTIGQPDDDKPLPTVDDVDSYLTTRVKPQYDEYYPRTAARNKRRLGQFRWVEFGLALLAAALAAVAAAVKLTAVGAWVAVVTTVAAAITAHIAASRYEHHVITYLATARQLRSRVAQWRDSSDHGPEAAARLVRDCEDVISRENESWMAAWTRDEGGNAAPAP